MEKQNECAITAGTYIPVIHMQDITTHRITRRAIEARAY